MLSRSSRASIDDRWHRPARRGEPVAYPADAAPGAAVWCMNRGHGTPGTMVCTGRHDQGQRWQARWVGDGRERSKSFTRKSDAQALVAQKITELTTGTYLDDRRSAVTLGEVAEEWLTAKSVGLKPSTRGNYRSVLDMSILPRWEQTRLSEITHADVQAWVTWMTTNPDARKPRTANAAKSGPRKPLSARRAVQAHGQFKQILAYAIRTRRLVANPADDVVLPRIVHRPDTALTHEQVGKLVAAAGDAGPILLTLAYTGMRFGELAALRVADVDLTRRRILVSKAVAQVTGVGLVEGTTKTHQVRSVPILTAALGDVLASVMAGRGANEHLFPAPAGGPMRNSYLRWRFDRACEGAGLTGVSIKTLRHSAGSLALAEGASVVTTQRLLGHKDATTTMRVYSHMLPDDFDNLAVAMDRAVTGLGPPS